VKKPVWGLRVTYEYPARLVPNGVLKKSPGTVGAVMPCWMKLNTASPALIPAGKVELLVVVSITTLQVVADLSTPPCIGPEDIGIKLTALPPQ
jgi:hypothetical protein